jgi:hypothetical protein
MNMSPFGSLLQDTCGKVGTPVLLPAWFGVSATLSVPLQPAPSCPDVVEVQPMADFVGRGAPEIERRGRGAVGAEGRVQDDDPVGGIGEAGELRIAEQAATELADPDIEVVRGRPGIHATGSGRFHRIVVGKRSDRGLIESLEGGKGRPSPVSTRSHGRLQRLKPTDEKKPAHF